LKFRIRRRYYLNWISDFPIEIFTLLKSYNSL